MSVPIKRNTAGQIVYVSLFDGADIVMTPTIADGDIQISLDGGDFAPLTTEPTATPAASGQVQIPLSQPETNAVHLGFRGIDQVGGEWDDFYYSVFTETGTIGDIAAVLSGITSLASWLGVLVGKSADVATLTEVQATTGGATYDNTTDSPQAITDTATVYQAKAQLVDDDTGTRDRYVVAWFRNSEPVTVGITIPKVRVIKASDGTDLVAETAMTQIGATGLYRYDEATNRVVNGAVYFVEATATIDGGTRTWYQPVGRDS